MLWATQAVKDRLRAEDVGHQELCGPGDAAVDVGLGGEVDDRLVPGEGGVDGWPVGDVSLDEGVARVVSDGREVGRVAGVRQLVEDGDLDVVPAGVAAAEQGPDVVRTDEPGAAGDEDSHNHAA